MSRRVNQISRKTCLVLGLFFTWSTHSADFERRVENHIGQCIRVVAQSDFTAAEKTIVEVELSRIQEVSHCGCPSKKVSLALINRSGKALKSKNFDEKNQGSYSVELPEIRKSTFASGEIALRLRCGQ